MSVSITRRSMIAGCLAGLMACGLGTTNPLEAMATQDTSATDDPKVSGGKGIPATNVAAVESYALLPEGALDKEMRTYLQLLDIAFSQTGLDKNAEPTGRFTLENCYVAGKLTSKIEAWYDDTSEEARATRINAVLPLKWGVGDVLTKEVCEAFSQSFGLADLQYTSKGTDAINCSIKIDGVGLVLDVINSKKAVYVEITPSADHAPLALGVDKTELSNLTNWTWSIDPNSYTPDSYANVVALIEPGGVVDNALNNPDATAVEVFDAMHQLRTADDKLVLSPINGEMLSGNHTGHLQFNSLSLTIPEYYSCVDFGYDTSDLPVRGTYTTDNLGVILLGFSSVEFASQANVKAFTEQLLGNSTAYYTQAYNNGHGFAVTTNALGTPVYTNGYDAGINGQSVSAITIGLHGANNEFILAVGFIYNPYDGEVGFNEFEALYDTMAGGMTV